MIYSEFNNKTALVTGGTKGIGKAIAQKLLSLKANVIITYNSNEISANQCKEEFAKKYDNFMIIKSDVSCVNECKKLLDLIDKNYSKLDYLVNNAGVLKQGNFFDIDEREWNWILNTNLKGPFFLSKDFVKRYRNGNIVNISSIGGQIGGDKAPHYAATKAAIISLTKSLARLGSYKNIRSNAVAPGWIKTEIFNDEQLKLLNEKAKEEILLKRLGETNEIASAVVFLLSNESSFITGHCMNVNGGMYFG